VGFHPHIHCLVPGAGLDRRGRWVCVKKADRLLHLPHLQAAFRQHLRQRLRQQGWQVDPTVWDKDWGVHIRPVGNGVAALKYLATYVARSVISDARLRDLNSHSVTFTWKNRDRANRQETSTVPGHEFVRRYLRHVLPRGLRSIRYYGFCHPAAKANRLRVHLHSGGPVQLGASGSPCSPLPTPRLCPRCQQPLRLLGNVPSPYRKRGPPIPAILLVHA